MKEIVEPELDHCSQSALMSRILLADDHPIVRQGLAALLGAEPDMEIVG